jgi:hypothetical protein
VASKTDESASDLEDEAWDDEENWDDEWEEGGLIFETESSIDFEELVSKYIFESD